MEALLPAQQVHEVVNELRRVRLDVVGVVDYKRTALLAERPHQRVEQIYRVLLSLSG